MKLGAEVERVKPVAIANPRHYVNLAREYAARCGCVLALWLVVLPRHVYSNCSPPPLTCCDVHHVSPSACVCCVDVHCVDVHMCARVPVLVPS